MSAAVIIARHLALKAIKQRRQKQGLREPLPFSTLTRLAHEWLDQHPELLAEAALSPIVQNSEHSNRRRRADLKEEFQCRCQVQNGAY
jgi:hypothetical protein